MNTKLPKFAHKHIDLHTKFSFSARSLSAAYIDCPYIQTDNDGLTLKIFADFSFLFLWRRSRLKFEFDSVYDIHAFAVWQVRFQYERQLLASSMFSNSRIRQITKYLSATKMWDTVWYLNLSWIVKYKRYNFSLISLTFHFIFLCIFNLIL